MYARLGRNKRDIRADWKRFTGKEKNPRSFSGIQKNMYVKGGEKKMEPNERECQTTDPTLCSESGCSKDPEDALLDLSKMTPEEKRDYLYELLRNRSFGC
jgi:hypothetical protein